LGLAFFTLPPNYTKLLYEELFFLVFQGGGGFTFSDVYNLPLHIRRLYVNQLLDIKKKENEEINKSNSKVRRR
jgi:hypothetical protein